MNTQTLQATQIITASDIMNEFAKNAGTAVTSTGSFYDIEIKLDTPAHAAAAGCISKVSSLYLHFNDLTNDQFAGLESAISEFWVWDDKKLKPESIKTIVELANDLAIQQPIIWPLSTLKHAEQSAFAVREKPSSHARALYIPKNNRVPVIHGQLSDTFEESAETGLFVYIRDGSINEHYKVLSTAQAKKQFKRADGADLVFMPDGRTNIRTFTR